MKAVQAVLITGFFVGAVGCTAGRLPMPFASASKLTAKEAAPTTKHAVAQNAVLQNAVQQKAVAQNAVATEFSQRESNNRNTSLAAVPNQPPASRQPARRSASAMPIKRVSHAANVGAGSTDHQMSQQAGTPQPSLVKLGPREDLSEVIGSASGVVLIDFYADWCGPCRIQGGILHELENVAAENGALMVKVNIDQHPQLAKQFDVSSLPTLVLLEDQKVIERQTGLANKTRVASLLAR